MEIIKKQQPKPDEATDPYKDLFLPFDDLDVLSVFKLYLTDKDNQDYINGLTKYQAMRSFCSVIDVYLDSFKYYLYELYSNKFNEIGWENPFQPTEKIFHPITFFKFEKYWLAWLSKKKSKEQAICFKIDGFVNLLKQIYFRMNEKALKWLDNGFQFKPLSINEFSYEWLTENEFSSLINFINPVKTAKPEKPKYNPDW